MSDTGQASVELALATPVLCILLLGVVQVAVVVRDQLTVIEAARVGARAASVAADPAGAAADAAAPTLADLAASRVDTAVHDDHVTVTAHATSVTDVPLVGALLPDIHLQATAAMILEPP